MTAVGTSESFMHHPTNDRFWPEVAVPRFKSEVSLVPTAAIELLFQIETNELIKKLQDLAYHCFRLFMLDPVARTRNNMGSTIVNAGGLFHRF